MQQKITIYIIDRSGILLQETTSKLAQSIQQL